MNYMLMPLKRYFDFSGRSRRKEFWMWILFVLIAYAVAIFLDVQLGTGGSATSYGGADGEMSAGFNAQGGIITMLVGLAMLIPGIAVAVRRMHDQDKSGWWLLIGLVPIIGGIWLIVLYCTEGTRGPNRFGPDPKGGVDAQQAFT